MTRETKIGLLVGLAFIIVIGILLSDHLTSSTEPPQATLAVAGNNVRGAVNTPGGGNNSPIVSTALPSPVSPRTTVPTQNDLSPHAQPVQPVQVAVGGPTSVQQPAAVANPSPVIVTTPMSASGPVVEIKTIPAANPPMVDTRSEPQVTAAPTAPRLPEPVAPRLPEPDAPAAKPVATNSNTDIAAALRDAAHQHGEELVTLGTGEPGNAKSSGAAGSSRQSASGKQYVAVEGDSLSKIAAKFLGNNSKANRDAIVNANASLKADPNKVIVGRTYNIPSGAASSSVVTAVPEPTPVQPIAATPSASVSVAADSTYTVKEGDSLWKIATEQCGSAAAVQQIKDLNKETLKGDTVVLNTKLKLPAKVASVN